MKKLLLSLILISLLSCNTAYKNTLAEDSCECINKINNDVDNEILFSEIQKCISLAYETHSDEVEKIITDFTDENPVADISTSQNHVRKILTEQLLQDCPKYASITSSLLTEYSTGDSKLIKTISNEICKEIDKLNVEKLSDELVDPIFIQMFMKYENQIRNEYNLSESEGMQEYANDLSFKLMADCEKYKLFGIQKN